MGNTRARERGVRRGHELEHVARRQLEPARDREYAVGGEAAEIAGKGLDGVERALVQRLDTRGRRGRGCDERQGDKVVARARLGDEGARIGDVDVDVLAVVKATGEVAEAVAHEVDHLRVDLDRVDVARAVVQGTQDAAAAAGAEHQHSRSIDHVIGQGRGLRTEVAELAEVTVETRDRRQCLAVDEHAELSGWLGGAGEAEAGRGRGGRECAGSPRR